MAKPIVVAKRQGPDWTVCYTEHESGEELFVSVFGSPTIEEALQDARASLDANHQGWYTITKVQLEEPTDDQEDEDG